MSFENLAVVDVNSVTKQAAVTIARDQIAKRTEEAVKRRAKTATLKGFRPGKAPLAMIQQLEGPRLRLEAIDNLLDETINNIITDKKFEVAGYPKVEIEKLDEGQDVSCKVTFFLYPNPELKGLESIDVAVTVAPVTDDDVERAITSLRESRQHVHAIKDRTEMREGDIVVGTSVTQIEGEEVSPSAPLVRPLERGKDAPEVVEALIGKQVGAEVVIESQVAGDDANEAARGKKRTMRITVDEIYEKHLPELDDEFAKTSPLEAQTVDELRLKIKERLAEFRTEEKQQKVRDAVMERLLADNDFEVPQNLIDMEMESLRVQSRISETTPKETIEKFDAEAIPVALKRVRARVMMDRVADREQVKVEEADIRAFVNKMIAKGAIGDEDLKRLGTDRDYVRSLMIEVRRTKALDAIAEKAKISVTEEAVK